MNTAVVFPGQGSQAPEMLSQLAKNDSETKALFELSSDQLGYDLRKLIDSEPEKLNQTEFTQPALFVSSFALWQKIKDLLSADVFAGHSLGEYNALVASGVLNFQDGLKLVQKRAQLMKISGSEKGAMAAVLGLEAKKIMAICSEFDGKVSAANFNAIDQTVIAGEQSMVRACSEKLKQEGAKRVIALPVSVASHCYLMKPASEKLAQFIKDIPFHNAKVPVLHNVDCKAYHDSKSIQKALISQLYQSVHWYQTTERFKNHYQIDQLIECGPGRVLANLATKSRNFQSVVSVNNEANLDQFLISKEKNND